MFVEKLVDTDIERIINDTEMKRRVKYMWEILQKRLSGVKESLMENAKNIFL